MSAVGDLSLACPDAVRAVTRPLSIAGLFAGIGGIELGLHRAGHYTQLLCEVDEAAKRVLATHFPESELVGDVRSIKRLPQVDLVTAGFPCQDLSQAGRTAGIEGAQSGLVGEVFRLLDDEARSPTWLLLENVPFMLQLDRGSAMRFLIDSLEALGFTWAYRVVDTRAFGLPQRRQRVLLLASRTEDPRYVLFAEDAGERDFPPADDVACGFYWTEGVRGLGWAVDAIPTLKGGSGLGIPSPPAIRLPAGGIVLPEIRDAERLQGFPSDWTLPGLDDRHSRQGPRWKMVGNAVSVPVSEWVGRRLRTPADRWDLAEVTLDDRRWPVAAWGRLGERREVQLTRWPLRRHYSHLAAFLRYETRPLSKRATSGFLSRTQTSSLRFPDGFIAEVESHLARVSTQAA
jgi:DNA (cytosine-5)-methyltransferase 1